MTNAISIFAADTSVVNYVTKKGDNLSMSAEGALFKPAALAAMKELAIKSAFTKAETGRYRAAADILSAAFPAVAKKTENFIQSTVWGSKINMLSFLNQLELVKAPEGKDFSKAKQNALGLVQALRTIPALASDKPATIIEA